MLRYSLNSFSKSSPTKFLASFTSALADPTRAARSSASRDGGRRNAVRSMSKERKRGAVQVVDGQTKECIGVGRDRGEKGSVETGGSSSRREGGRSSNRSKSHE
jgi:hypothetical protein